MWKCGNRTAKLLHARRNGVTCALAIIRDDIGICQEEWRLNLLRYLSLNLNQNSKKKKLIQIKRSIGYVKYNE